MNKTESKKPKKAKSPATPAKGIKIVHTLKFVTIYEYIPPSNPAVQWWVVENNIYANSKVIIHIKMGRMMHGQSWEQGRDGSQDVVIRSYYPKNTYSEEKVLGLAESDNWQFEREWKKFQKFKRTKSSD